MTANPTLVWFPEWHTGTSDGPGQPLGIVKSWDGQSSLSFVDSFTDMSKVYKPYKKLTVQ